MWSNGPFARPVSSFEAPVPPVGVDPTVGPFFYVAINQAWMPYVLGSLLQLLLQTTWENPSADPDVLDLAQLQAFNLLQQFQIATNQCPAGSYPIPIAESDYEMSLCEQLRFQDGKLQALCCGEWTDISGQGNNLGVGLPDQPGDGLPQPTAGGCQTYHGKMPANGPWNLPTGVNAGDIITVSNVMGATNGGILDSWYCWEGDTYFLGTCIPATGDPQAGDPLPTVKHMRLLALIDGTYYDATSPITVPMGVANAPVVFQVNAATLSTNAGDLAFDVEVCNNQPTTFTHVFNLPLTTGKFQLEVQTSQSPDVNGVWTAGSGWADASAVRTDGHIVHSLNIQLPIGSTITLTGATMTYDLVKGTFNAGTVHNYVQFRLSGSTAAIASVDSSLDTDGTGKTLTIAPGSYSSDLIYIQFVDSYYTGSGADGTGVVTQLIVSGLGTDPF